MNPTVRQGCKNWNIPYRFDRPNYLAHHAPMDRAPEASPEFLNRYFKMTGCFLK